MSEGSVQNYSTQIDAIEAEHWSLKRFAGFQALLALAKTMAGEVPERGAFKCCGASDTPCPTFEASCQNPANYPSSRVEALENLYRAATPFAEIMLGSSGRIPTERLSAENWHELTRAFVALQVGTAPCEHHFIQRDGILNTRICTKCGERRRKVGATWEVEAVPSLSVDRTPIPSGEAAGGAGDGVKGPAESDVEAARDLDVGGAQLAQAGGNSGGMPLSVGRSRPDQTATSSTERGADLVLQRGAVPVLNPDNAGHSTRESEESRDGIGSTIQAPAHDNLRVPSELLFLLSDPLMGPAITRFVADVRAALGQQPATEEAAKALVKRLRDTPNWSRESWGGSWKNTTTHYDRAPFEAADMIEKLSGGGAVPVEGGEKP